MKKKDIFNFIIFMFILFLVGAGMASLYKYVVIAMPRQSAIDVLLPDLEKEIPLPNLLGIDYQLKGKDLLIKNVIIQDIGYTESMVPTMYGGNSVILKPYPYYNKNVTGICPELEEGQIAVYVHKDFPSLNYIIHRVIDNNVGEGQVRFKGDNNRASEFVECNKIKYIALGVLYT